MRILLQDLPEGHSIVRRREDAADLQLEPWFRPAGPLEVELDAERRGDRVTFRGRVRLEGEQDCARCVKPFRFELGAEILVLAERRGTDDPRDEAALEADGEVLYHDGVSVELDPRLREALILDLPVVLICRPDCRGLCPQCGRDRNEGECGCPPPPGDARWDALKGLSEERES